MALRHILIGFTFYVKRLHLLVLLLPYNTKQILKLNFSQNNNLTIFESLMCESGELCLHAGPK